GRAVHGRARVLLLRGEQGRCHAGDRRTRGDRPGGLLRLLGLLHRHPDARGGGAPRGRESGPGAPAGSRQAWLAGQGPPPPGAAPPAIAPGAGTLAGCGRAGGLGRGGGGGRVALLPPAVRPASRRVELAAFGPGYSSAVQYTLSAPGF